MNGDTEKVNIFKSYTQKENHFTNGLISILSLGQIQDPEFVNDFMLACGIVDSRDDYDTFKVLAGYDEAKSTVDAKIIGRAIAVHFETKIVSASLDQEQIDRHLSLMNDERRKNILVLLTPDDSRSNYIDQFLKDAPKNKHLGWMRVYEYLESYSSKCDGVFKSLVDQYLATIKDTIFEQDMVGVILKVEFGPKSEVYQDSYREKVSNLPYWNTPREYKSLNGTGRKLLLYDTVLKAITVEVEIERVERTGEVPEYPWNNYFVQDTLLVFENPIKIGKIQQLRGFENFSKERSPCRNLTRTQYDAIMRNVT